MRLVGGNVSIHVPHGGDDVLFMHTKTNRITFQSTSPTGGTTVNGDDVVLDLVVSIHVPHGGDDTDRV